VFDRLINTMEKIIKVKGCQIQEFDLVSTICNACIHFRIRCPVILEGVSEYFLHNKAKLSVPQIYSMASVFGELDFHPTSGFKFWKELEYVLEEKFVQFKPNEIIQLLISFLYIEKYPLNFTNKLFNPYFLDRIHSQTDIEVFRSRQQLKLFDAAMELKCKGYGGPYLPTDIGSLRLESKDRRIVTECEYLFGPLGEIVEDYSRIGISIVLSALPLHNNYIVDMMIYPTRASALLRFGFLTENSSNIAVLINLPEHYDRKDEHLIGNQILKIRHLRRMGFRIITLRYSKLKRLKPNPEKLKDYLREEYRKVVDKKKR
jgi:Xaa-Pro dipeptidase